MWRMNSSPKKKKLPGELNLSGAWLALYMAIGYRVFNKACWPNGKALDYGSRDCRFESCVGHFFLLILYKYNILFYIYLLCVLNRWASFFYSIFWGLTLLVILLLLCSSFIQRTPLVHQP
ncbi:hypothetical protein BDV26DRAFT_160282 [Aspergillus bertholletiae]|uniref:Uncharacterized protein n=1 Tax=Aspergillus bertholletiae TaxID=1226010 RepID=A0A5N7BMX5_9EURO|nr:hypothetical protein BDV26DRAFT_160282 [Aspergillus bertholletiae]